MGELGKLCELRRGKWGNSGSSASLGEGIGGAESEEEGLNDTHEHIREEEAHDSKGGSIDHAKQNQRSQRSAENEQGLFLFLKVFEVAIANVGDH